MKTTPPIATGNQLQSAASELILALDSCLQKNEARSQQIEQLMREAETWQHRRAANSARDRGCYRIGAALEPYEGHLLDDIALSGLDHLGAVGLVLLVDIAVRSPDLSLSQLLDRLFRSNHGEVIRKWGEWSRWHWLSELVNRETNVFLASEKGRDPRQRWRSEEPTLNQEYLLLEIARIGGLIAPKLSTRGDAFEWIRDQGGNPRFRNPPPSPPLPIWGA